MPRAPALKICDYWPTLKAAGITRVDAVAPVPGLPDEFYIFRGGKYTRICLNPSTLHDRALNEGVLNITYWSALSNAPFYCVDAAMTVPGRENEFYFFSGSQYLRCIVDTPSLVDTLHHQGPYDIKELWPTLGACGFSSIDATMAVPGHPNQFYFFSGTRYIRSYIDSYSLREEKQAEGVIYQSWPTLCDAGFTTVDACMPVPGTDDQMYVFSGAEYIKIKIDKTTLVDTRV